MASPMRLSPDLVETAARGAAVSKRTVPKQIEHWANLGKMVERMVDYADLIAVDQGIKRIRVETVESFAPEPDDVFGVLEKKRENGELSRDVTQAVLYYEASATQPGLIDQVNATTGERRAGMFKNGDFVVVRK